MRTPHGQFAEYHTSADNLEFVQPGALADSFMKCLSIFSVLDGNGTYLNLNPKCEPQLGRRGLYRHMGGQVDTSVDELALLWALNMSDGSHSLLDIAEQANLPFDKIWGAADTLVEFDLLSEILDRTPSSPSFQPGH